MGPIKYLMTIEKLYFDIFSFHKLSKDVTQGSAILCILVTDEKIVLKSCLCIGK